MSHRKAAVIKAIIGNTLVTIAKGVAAIFSGSGAMVAECIHSFVDTLNQCLLLIGVHRSNQKATKQHPYGFGIEANFWGLLAAIGILFLGGGLTIQHALHSIHNPQMPEALTLTFSILGFSTLIESWVLLSVMKDLLSTRGELSWLIHLRRQSSETITVLLEDFVAVLGCLFAATAIGLCVVTQNGIWDVYAQLIIGCMLACVGVFLIWRNRGMLVGKSIRPDLMHELRIFLADLDGIHHVHDLKTRQLTPNTFTLKAEVVFSGSQLAEGLIPQWTTKFSTARKHSEVAIDLGRYADDLMHIQAQHVDTMEQAIREEFPGALYIDLEPHRSDLE